MTRGRLAPSPTGDMHLGNARTALLAWLAARAHGGALVMRVEDLDKARVRPEAEARILTDLHALGLHWDEGPDRGGPFGPYRQSERLSLYDDALAKLRAVGRVYPCSCTRADVARAASAPHQGEEGPRYPGNCRDRAPAATLAEAQARGRKACWRFRADAAPLWFDDEVAGRHGGPIDDFVVQRADGVVAYQLAVVVDDAAMGITSVVRGDDLLSSTPRQLALYHALGLRPPSFAHVPLVLDAEGERLAKRTRPASVRALLQAGVPASRILARLGASAGLCRPDDDVDLHALARGFSFARISRTPVVLSSQQLQGAR